MEVVENLVKTTLWEIEKVLTTRTVVGEPMTLERATLIPLVSVGFGFGAGGGEGKGEAKQKGEGAGGGTGGGAFVKEDEGKIELFRLQAELCKSLSDPKRLQIIQELRGGEKAVNELAGILELKQSNTSQHIAVLRRIGIITPRKDGNTVYYRLADTKIAEACHMVHDVIASQLRRSEKLFSLMQA